VPAFGVKKDGIPGFVNEAWFNIDADKKGLYRGQCAELCGRDHGFMPIVVDARSKEDFQAWLTEKAAQQKQAAAPAGTETTPTASTPAAAAPTAGGPAVAASQAAVTAPTAAVTRAPAGVLAADRATKSVTLAEADAAR
jgi:cytochrome c oxidase subunit 2